jgi:hypothetical protein
MLGEGRCERALREARKHVGWYLQSALPGPRWASAVRAWRARLLRAEEAAAVLLGLREFYAQAPELAA